MDSIPLLYPANKNTHRFRPAEEILGFFRPFLREEAVKVFPDLPDNPPQVLIKKRPIQYPWGLSDPKFEFFHSLAASCKEAPCKGAGWLGETEYILQTGCNESSKPAKPTSKNRVIAIKLGSIRHHLAIQAAPGR